LTKLSVDLLDIR